MKCPSCQADLDGPLIYETLLEQYGDSDKALEAAKMYGATKTSGRFGRVIEDEGKFICPDCTHVWKRR